jgi:3-methyladenine DNA glycosylase Mpg
MDVLWIMCASRIIHEFTGHTHTHRNKKEWFTTLVQTGKVTDKPNRVRFRISNTSRIGINITRDEKW